MRSLACLLIAVCVPLSAQNLSLNVPLTATAGASMDLSLANYLRIPSVTSDPAGACTNAAAIVLNTSSGIQAGDLSGCVDGNWRLIGGGTGGGGALPGTVYISQSNVFGAFLQDFSASTLTLPKATGAAPTASGQISYDLTTNSYKGGFNGSTKTFTYFSGSPVVGDCAQIGSNGNIISAGGPCAAGGGLVSINGLTPTAQSFIDDTNVTVVHGGSTHTITWVGTLAKNRTLGSTVYADQANPYSAFLQDFSAATLKIPVGAGLAPLTSGLIGYDSTANLLVAGINGVTGKVPYFTGSPSGCVSIASGVLSGSGIACGSGGGSGAFSGLTAGTNTTAAMVIGSGASLTTTAGGTNVATSVNGTGTFSVVGNTGTAPTVQAAQLGCWFDSTDNNLHCKDPSANQFTTVKTNGTACPTGSFVSGIATNGTPTCGVPGIKLLYSTPATGINQSATTNTTLTTSNMVTPVAPGFYQFQFYLTQTSIGTGCTSAGNIGIDFSYIEGGTGTAIAHTLMRITSAGESGTSNVASMNLSTASLTLTSTRGSATASPSFYAGPGGPISYTVHNTAAASSGCSSQPQIAFYPVLTQVY